MRFVCRKGHRWHTYQHPSGPSQWKGHTGKDHGIQSRWCERCGRTEYAPLGATEPAADFAEAQRMFREGDYDGLTAMASRNVKERAAAAAKEARDG